MAFYKKKPVIIEAREFTGTDENLIEITEWICDTNLNTLTKYALPTIKKDIERYNGYRINTLEGLTIASVGDFIIKGVQGEFYACKPDIFHLTYELQDSQNSQNSQNAQEK